MCEVFVESSRERGIKELLIVCKERRFSTAIWAWFGGWEAAAP